MLEPLRTTIAVAPPNRKWWTPRSSGAGGGFKAGHIVLAALVVPLALTTIHRAWRGRFDRHRRLARVTLPIWLYVSVLVYVLLYHSGC